MLVLAGGLALALALLAGLALPAAPARAGTANSGSGARTALSGTGGARLAQTTARTAPVPGSAPPGIDPAYVYAQLDYMVNHFQHREAGYLTGSAGHAGFARYWRRQMLTLLGRFGARARDYPFAVRGWLGRPATAPAVDVEVTVPGLADPASEVVIGCHYDGEADSTESANDDGSGCAIELGVAKAMAAYWRKNGVYPARTLRFVLFDAEEQGLVGSYDYVNTIARNDLPDVSAMINEEQNGIAYPLRYLGRSASPLMPLFAYLSPLTANRVYPRYSTSPRQRAGLMQLRRLVRRAVPSSFRRYRAIGDQMLTYHHGAGPDVRQPVFSPAETGKVRVLGDNIGSSDQLPFTQAGVRSAMFVGNSTYYQRHPPAGSYPYDRPQDTIALMNTFADGGPAESHALELALGLPGMLTTWLLSRPPVLGQARPDGRPVAAIGDIGVLLPGHPASFDADASYEPGRPGADLSYAWNFGDGRSATGRSVRHVYSARGSYTLRLTVSSGSGLARQISRRVVVGPRVAFANPYSSVPHAAADSIAYLAAKGMPPANPGAVLPTPAPGRRDRVGTVAHVRRLAARSRSASAATGPTSALIWVLTGFGAAALLGVVFAVALRTRKTRRAGRRP